MNLLYAIPFPMSQTGREARFSAWRLCIGAAVTAALMGAGGCGGGGGDETPAVALETSQLLEAKKKPDASPPAVAERVPVASKRPPDDKKKPDVPDVRPSLVAQPVSVVNTTTAGEQEVRAIGALSTGGYAVAWRSGQGFYTQRYDSAGNRVGSETAIQLAGDPQDGLTHRLETSIGVLSDGTSLVAYVVRRDMGDFGEVGLYLQRFDENGAQILPATLIDSQTFAARRVTDIGAVRILPRSDGGYVVSWGTFSVSATVGSRNRWSAQQFDGDNRPAGAPINLNAQSTVNTLCRIVADGNDGYTTYCSGTREDGAPTGLAITHYDANQSMTQILTGWAGPALLLPLEDGRYVLYTSDAGGAYRQFLDSAGGPVGERTAAVSMPSSAQLLVDGTYVVFWSAGGGETAQRFAANGDSLDDVFTVGTAGAPPMLAPLAEGGFAAAWSAAVAPADLDVYTQQFSEVGPSSRKACLAEVKAKGLRGQERKAFMTKCLR